MVLSLSSIIPSLKQLNTIRKRKYQISFSGIITLDIVYVTAVLEYLMAELLELSGDKAHADRKSRITPRHIQLAISTDDE